MRYRATFLGCLHGAIGLPQRCVTYVTAPDPEYARLRLYETHEHITDLRLTDVSETTPGQRVQISTVQTEEEDPT